MYNPIYYNSSDRLLMDINIREYVADLQLAEMRLLQRNVNAWARWKESMEWE